ncbi:hypothetical protein [Pseudodesulfovibrio senegalensis]|uniref:DUF2802 domain-containing protein n=1 Tax=Pseudodesulfovibrio senegalensis TaxID=1721087 RepID=A0A6N6N7I4_9BACT|nr:hypothetical protein [Pseudodesulfovibrio senegalensis]KAB1443648.1 hypothetical protein F8A88_05260 [Pseudodesulfovibrio senegalensis]
MSTLLLVFFSLTEIALLCIVIAFFVRLKKSEALLSRIQAKQEEFINRLHFNAQLENEMVATFEQRQGELAELNDELENKVRQLKKLMRQADEYTRSPQFLRQIVLDGHKSGKSPAQLARKAGLSLEEVELIINQSRNKR